MDWLSRKQIDFHLFHLDDSTTKMEGVLAEAYNKTGKARSPLVVHPDLSANPMAMVDQLVVAATNSLRVASLSPG